MTLIEIIQHIAQFGKDHQKVGTEIFGDRIEVDKEPTNGVVMWHGLGDSSVEDGVMALRYNVSFMDVLQPDESNEVDVLSDTFWMCESFIAYMSEMTQILNRDFQMDNDGEISWFTHTEDSEYAGHNVELVFRMGMGRNNNLLNYCDIPFLSDPSIPAKANRIKKMYSVIESFVDNHLNINYTHFGRQVEVDFEDSNSFILWWYLDSANHDNGQVSIAYRFVIAGQMQDDLSNDEELYSDCLEICKDLHSYLDHYAYDGNYELTDASSLKPLNGVPSSKYCGWSLLLEASYGNEFDVEQIPTWQHIADENGTFVIDEEGNTIQIL